MRLQCEKLQMISVYFKVLQWLINVKLLPECSVNTLNNESVPYLVETISDYYNKRLFFLYSLFMWNSSVSFAGGLHCNLCLKNASNRMKTPFSLIT